MRIPSLTAVSVASVAACAFASVSQAAPLQIPMNAVTADGIGKSIGTVSAVDTAEGVRLTPMLTDLSPGQHGFHLHDRGSCEPGPDPDKGGANAAAFAAGGHYDPGRTGKHEGPKGLGHKGDLPYLIVGPDGQATASVVASQLKAADLLGHTLMVHEGGDNYSDQPTKLGGGAGRVACGVVPAKL